MSDPRTEQVLKLFEARIIAIKTTTGYLRKGKLKSVQRYIHEWLADGHEVNKVTEETVLIRTIAGRVAAGATEELIDEMDVLFRWVLIGGMANDSDVQEVKHDLLKALWKDWTSDGLQSLIQTMTADYRTYNAQTETATDGFELTATIAVRSQAQDPTQGS